GAARVFPFFLLAALPIWLWGLRRRWRLCRVRLRVSWWLWAPLLAGLCVGVLVSAGSGCPGRLSGRLCVGVRLLAGSGWLVWRRGERRSTRLNSSHVRI